MTRMKVPHLQTTCFTAQKNMAEKYEKSEIASADREMDRSSLEHGAVEQLHIPSYQFSPEAEKRLVRKIDLTSVAFDQICGFCID